MSLVCVTPSFTFIKVYHLFPVSCYNFIISSHYPGQEAYSLTLNKIRECAVAALTDSEAVADRLTNTCEAEQKGQREAMERTLADEIRLAVDARQWVESIQEYRDITELDASTLNRLIKEIVVHETIDSDKTRHISIEIHFNLKPIPEVEQVTG